MPSPSLQPTIGLEIHLQLRTRTKMFCADAAEFGGEPNTRVCPVCLGLPGALPVPNARAVELGVRAALGLGCAVRRRSSFSRKHYAYPDLPKGYQITQHDAPLAEAGRLEVPDGGEAGEPVRIRRLHLEEDTGRLIHARASGETLVDFNRAGVPLVEIVTEPDLDSPARARAFLLEIKRVLEYLEVSDCNMEEGSLRVDANVSVRASGEAPGIPTELKNLNSFSNLEQALEFEIARQSDLRRRGRTVERQTLLWDAARGEARPMRGKEDAAEYRYMPEPDLPPLVLEEGWIESMRRALPELPSARRVRFQVRYSLAPGAAEVLTATRALADYYEAVVAAGAEPRQAAGWVSGEVLAALNALGQPISRLRISPARLAELLEMLDRGALARPAAREVFARMLETGEPAARVVAEAGLARVDDRDELAAWSEQVLRDHPAEVARYRAGETKLLSFFIGQVMRLSRGRANPKQVREMLATRLSEG